MQKEYYQVMSKYYKYNRTYHLEWSPGLQNDDRRQINYEEFKKSGDIVATIKMDGENCVDGNTIINTENGNKTIQEICENKFSDKVLSFNHELEINEYKEIISHSITEPLVTDDWFEITLEDNTTLKITGEHYVFLPLFNCYRMVKDLNTNDEIVFLP